MLNSSLRCCIIKILVNIRMFSHFKQGVLNRFFYRFLFGFFLIALLAFKFFSECFETCFFVVFFAFNLLAVVNTMHMYGMCTGVCECGCICYLYIYMYVHNAYRHAKNIIYSCVGVLVFAFYPLPLSCSTCFLSLFFFSVYATNHFTCHAFDSFAHTDIQSTIMPVVALVVVVVVTVSFVVLMACH